MKRLTTPGPEDEDNADPLFPSPALGILRLGPPEVTALSSAHKDARAEPDPAVPLTRRELRTQAEALRDEKRPSSRNKRDRPGEKSGGIPGKLARWRSEKSRHAFGESGPPIPAAVHPATSRFRQPRLFSLAALLFAGAFMLVTSLPAMAIPNHRETRSMVEPLETQVEGQTLAVGQASEGAEAVQRDSWGVTSRAEMLRLQYGTRDYSYSVNYTGPVRWPFPYTVPISSGFGDRQAPCRGCSTDHKGIDFAPGGSIPTYAIADGVVSSAQEGWSYGVHIFIEHEINGQKVTSLYAHMVTGSSPLQPGQVIDVGDFVGMVGNTGASTGDHLHLEIRPDGVPVDPLFWLRLNAA